MCVKWKKIHYEALAEFDDFLFWAALKYFRVIFMKKKGMEWLLAVTMGIVLPALLFMIAEQTPRENKIEQTFPDATTVEPEQQETTEMQVYESANILVLHDDGTICEYNLDTYVVGVVLGEMPADFEIEALKAQAVVARTYALKRNTTGKKHKDGAVCTNPGCCQAYCSVESYLMQGGLSSSVEKVKGAVMNTTGQVLTYKGNLIEATYFSCSGGKTEDAVAVWGTDVPYLQAVESPGEEKADYYTNTMKYTGKEFAERLGIKESGSPSTWLGAVAYTEGDGVDNMVIGGKVFKGTVLRTKLGLRSTSFSIKAEGDMIVITTKGFGHRVGMSQYGADAMAVKGSTYSQILQHYYPGTTLQMHT